MTKRHPDASNSPDERAIPTGSDRIRHLFVSVFALLAIAGAMLGAGVFGGDPVQTAAGGAFAADATPIAPATTAFSIWSVIYAGLVAYAVWQWLPSQAAAPRHRAIGYLVAASMLLNALWLLVVQADLLWLSILVMLALLAVLIRIFVVLQRMRPTGLVDAVVTDGTIGLYLGWIMIATAANIAAVLADAGLRDTVTAFEGWAIAVLVVAGAIGVALAVWGRGRLAPSAALSWGLAWVAVGRLTGEPASDAVGWAAAIIAAVVVVVTVVVRVRSRVR